MPPRMTALKKYQRLESPGLWRETSASQRREVVVAFRKASLVLFDPRTETPLSHWSLPAVERRNPGELPALFSPGEDAEESVEIEDADMIAAIEKIRSVVRRRAPRPGRLRSTILGGMLLAVVSVGVIFLPETIYTHTARVLPHTTRAALGMAALTDIQRLTGAACATPKGSAALDRMSERLYGVAGPDIFVLPEGLTHPAHLPGPIALLPAAAVLGQQTPEATAGFVLAAGLRADAVDPMVPLLRHAGFMATVRLLTSGVLPAGALAGFGEVFLATPDQPPSDESMLAAFQAAKLSSTPYGFALDASGETTLGLIEADPWRSGTPDPILRSEEWQALQAICTGQVPAQG